MATDANNQKSKPNLSNGSHITNTDEKSQQNDNNKASSSTSPIESTLTKNIIKQNIDSNNNNNNNNKSASKNLDTDSKELKQSEDQTIHSLDFSLSQKVESKLREVIPSDDPLDSADFNVIEHINSLFPTEESLGDVHEGKLAISIQQIRRNVNNIDIELSRAVQQAAENRRKTQTAISETQLSIQDLFKKVKSIKEKAEQSEIMVNEICSDIRKLDNAKKNLSDSITTLQKLHMLVSGVEQLQKDASTKSYDRASHLVRALNDLFQHFQHHLKMTQLKSLKLDMEKCREELKKAIYRDFRMFNPKDVIDVDGMSENLRNACEVIDALGSEERTKFVEWFGDIQLQAYGAIFAPGGEKSGIEFLERRFEWLKNQLLKYNKNYKRIFPRYWNVQGNICKIFCDVTRKHLIEILKQSQQLNNLDMNDLVKALEQCVGFEKELQRLYSQPSFSDDLEKIRASITQLLGDYNEDELYKDPMTSDKIKKRYKLEKLKKKLADCESQIAREEKNKSEEQKERETIEDISFIGILSSAFNKYLHYYVELERKSIEDVLKDIRENEEWVCTIDNIPNEARYAGIDDLLGYIKQSIHRCAKIFERFGTGDIFYKIYFEYKDGLKAYVDLLKIKVNSTNEVITAKNRNQRDIRQELISLSLIVNTLEYLSETLPALQGKLKSSMTNEKLAKKIDLKDVQEGKCDELAAKTVECIAQLIVQKIGYVLDKEVPSCRRWNEQEQSGDRSSFLQSLKNILNNDIAIVHELLVMSYQSLLNSKMSQRLIPKYTSCIFRIRRISGQGALQLQLDTRDFEKTVLNLPMIGLDGDDQNDATKDMNIHPNQNKNVRIPNAFKNNTSKQVNRIQSLLKTINTPYSPTRLDDIATFFKDVSDKKGNHQDLSKICEIKGLKKHEIQSVINTYNRMIPNNQQHKPLINQSQNNNNKFNDDVSNFIPGLLRNITSSGSVFAKK